jgi:hypothetical protein
LVWESREKRPAPYLRALRRHRQQASLPLLARLDAFNILEDRVGERVKRWLLLFLVSILPSAWAYADSWALPTSITYVSSSGDVRVTVVPRGLDGQIAYFNDKVKGREPAGQRTGETSPTARAAMERRVAGRWIKVWLGPLVNDVAPVSALVSDDARHLVTFDNWHSVGLGDNVVVIYDDAGKVVRSLRLGEILPATYIKALPTSVSSLWWGGKHSLSPDGRQVLLAVVVPDDDRSPGDKRATVQVAVDLDTGTVLQPTGPAWTRALEKAEQIAHARDAAEAARKAAFVAPLSAPATTGEREWHDYMREAFFRLDRDWKRFYPSTTVLRAPGAKDYKASEGWVREALDGTEGPGVAMLAAPLAPDTLVAVVQRVVRRVPADKLRGIRIYLAVPTAPAAAIKSALAATGAEVVALDLTAPIPQRPERLRGETLLDDLANDSGGVAAGMASEMPLVRGKVSSTPPADDLDAMADALEREADKLEAQVKAANRSVPQATTKRGLDRES